MVTVDFSCPSLNRKNDIEDDEGGKRMNHET